MINNKYRKLSNQELIIKRRELEKKYKLSLFCKKSIQIITQSQIGFIDVEIQRRSLP